MTNLSELVHLALHGPRFHRHWRLLLAALLIVISWLAFTPHPPGLEFEDADKLQHVLAFGTLAAVATFAWRAGWRACCGVAFGLLLYGVFIELVQSFLPTRSADAADVAADCVGIAVGLLAAAALRRVF